MNEEIMKVLKMVEDGKIDSQKASELISLLTTKNQEIQADANREKMLKILVKSAKGDDVKINVPVKFISTLGSAIKKIPKVEGVDGLEEIDLQAILKAVSEGLEGKIVDVKSEQGDLVEIIVE
ncbi:hypothetical protein Q428_02630 [Fervidicella metallireducens AeB]|uniref:YvlB/LiaX N-terminal domain-containing protein n=1 Tax=Fervidicella metallireducens AeB TaxID=1403537 RepID=A0A017RXC6_9CLOT|nr:hypothetical protein [Fervidicella metallireducens]EYE89352.1 hypothetical protein Q428_02630 [Fervidicella metallireducens AeB]